MNIEKFVEGGYRMSRQKLRCNCGEADNFALRWQKSGKWQLILNCCKCGAIYVLAESENDKCSARELADGGYCNYHA